MARVTVVVMVILTVIERSLEITDATTKRLKKTHVIDIACNEKHEHDDGISNAVKSLTSPLPLTLECNKEHDENVYNTDTGLTGPTQNTTACYERQDDTSCITDTGFTGPPQKTTASYARQDDNSCNNVDSPIAPLFSPVSPLVAKKKTDHAECNNNYESSIESPIAPLFSPLTPLVAKKKTDHAECIESPIAPLFSPVTPLVAKKKTDHVEFNYESSIIQVWSAPGVVTRLPCNLAAPSRDVAMMLWFKDGDRMPIYTVDFRNGPPVHWAVAGEFGARTHFVLNESDPSSAHLAVEKVIHRDEGVYRCRIDYVDSPTRNYRVNLTVVVPPESPRIYDSEGREILGTVAGTLREGQDLLLSCQASGGKPPPDVSWYRGEERLAYTREGSVCQLLLQELTREMAGTRLQCRVEPPLIKAVYRDVTLKLFLKPQFVRVTGNGISRAGHDRAFVCTTRGSKPAPNIDWFINSQKIDSTMTELDVDGEVTRSVLTWRVRREDSGRHLVCRVSNPWFPAYTLEDSLILDVMYPPVAQISLLEPREARLLREDENAELLCSADASPAPNNFTFYKEDHLIRDDPIGGIAVEGNKLIFRGLRRHHSSRYRCRARNSEGSALSEPLTFNVMSRPECSAGSVVQQLAGAPGGEVRARCSVTAPSVHEAGPLRFYWTYNGTKDVLPIPASNMTVTGWSSTVVHGLPQDSDEDLGWLACWASNDVGNQREPCLFRIMPAALPEPPVNCELDNSLLQCEPGHDGGLPQRFLLEVLEVRPSEPVHHDEVATLNDQGFSRRGISETVYRASNDAAPRFSIKNLASGRYTFLVFSETSRGRSPTPAALHSISIHDLDEPRPLQTMTSTTPPPSGSDNSVALLVGAALSLILMTILTTLCVALVVMCKKKTRPPQDPEQSTILRRSVGVSMYGGSSIQPTVVPTVVVRGHRGSRVLAARWSGVLDDTQLAVLALDTRAHDDFDCNSDDHQETEFTKSMDDMETQTDS